LPENLVFRENICARHLHATRQTFLPQSAKNPVLGKPQGVRVAQVAYLEILQALSFLMRSSYREMSPLKLLASNIQICPFYERRRFAHFIKSDFTKKTSRFYKTRHIFKNYAYSESLQPSA
jgi:hypothetical protein